LHDGAATLPMLNITILLLQLLSRLSALPSPPSASHILSLILRSSSPATGLKGSEERDLLFARLFGLNALVSSQLLTSGQGGGARTWNSCCAALIALGDRKAWLRESAWFSLIRAVRILLEGEGPEWKSEAVDGLLETIYKAVNEETGKRGLPWTQEKLALTILLQQLQPVR
jgi:DNA polymerase phi